MAYLYTMTIDPGIFLKSCSLLDGSVFEKTLLFIFACNEKGATGFIINQPFGRRLNQLQEFSHIRDFPLYNGGPVDPEHLYFIHRRPDLVEDSIKICEGVFYGGNFNQAVKAVNSHKMSEADIKIFIGYCGWDKDELEAEMEEGSWEAVTAIPDTVFMK